MHVCKIHNLWLRLCGLCRSRMMPWGLFGLKRGFALGHLGIFVVLAPFFLPAVNFAQAGFGSSEVELTILHTNDMHSHFRPDHGPLQLGGVSRLKTAIDQERAAHPYTFLVDGGDWSEGQVYYVENAGVESVRMLDRLGYDVAVLGNHEYLNGPGHLLNSLIRPNPRVGIVAANISTSEYDREPEFQEWVHPYLIREIGGVRVAFIGVVTYENVTLFGMTIPLGIYDRFFSPVTIQKPRDVLGPLVSQLKKDADVIVVISHNNLKNNQALLEQLPDIDLIIGAHDHKKLTQPIEVTQADSSGHLKSSWLVEAGSWGQYLGKVTIKVKPSASDDPDSEAQTGRVQLSDYSLIQIDQSIPEDPEINEYLDQLEGRLEKQFGHPIFHDDVGVSQLDLNRIGVDSGMGNFVTDAYLDFTGADLALESTKFVYGQIHHGPMRTVDFFNIQPGVYNPETGKTWTLRTFPISGRLLKWFLYSMYSTNGLSSLGLLSSAGLEAVYDPFFSKKGAQVDPLSRFRSPALSGINSSGIISGIADGLTYLFKNYLNVTKIKIRGKELDPDGTYRVATGGGIIEAIQFINTYSPVPIPLDEVEDTGVKNWQVLLNYFQARSPLSASSGIVSHGGRVQTRQPDLGVYYDDVQWNPVMSTPEGVLAGVSVRVTNYGSMASPSGFSSLEGGQNGPRLQILKNKNGLNYGLSEDYVSLAEALPIRSLEPGESDLFFWEVVLPEYNGLFEVTIQISGNDSETNHTNDQVTRWFRNRLD